MVIGQWAAGDGHVVPSSAARVAAEAHRPAGRALRDRAEGRQQEAMRSS